MSGKTLTKWGSVCKKDTVQRGELPSQRRTSVPYGPYATVKHLTNKELVPTQKVRYSPQSTHQWSSALLSFLSSSMDGVNVGAAEKPRHVDDSAALSTF